MNVIVERCLQSDQIDHRQVGVSAVRCQIAEVLLEVVASGADIYLPKPASVEELGAAIEALARRIRPQARAQDTLCLNPITLQLQGPRHRVHVSSHESLLLSAFAKALERRLERWQLIELLGKSTEEFSKTALEMQIGRLPKKLEQAGAPAPTIKAIRGEGYRLCVAVQIAQSAVLA